MLPTTIRSPPELGSYIPLEQYQSSTPETFFGGKPVLHHHLKGAKAWIPREQRASLPVFGSDSPAASATDGTSLNGVSEDLVEQVVDVYVSSEYVHFHARLVPTHPPAPSSLGTVPCTRSHSSSVL